MFLQLKVWPPLWVLMYEQSLTHTKSVFIFIAESVHFFFLCSLKICFQKVGIKPGFATSQSLEVMQTFCFYCTYTEDWELCSAVKPMKWGIFALSNEMTIKRSFTSLRLNFSSRFDARTTAYLNSIYISHDAAEPRGFGALLWTTAPSTLLSRCEVTPQAVPRPLPWGNSFHSDFCRHSIHHSAAPAIPPPHVKAASPPPILKVSRNDN